VPTVDPAADDCTNCNQAGKGCDCGFAAAQYAGGTPNESTDMTTLFRLAAKLTIALAAGSGAAAEAARVTR